jgi:putative transposase
MSVRKVNFVKGEYYHIYNRGNSKHKIFHDKQDYFRFIDLLFISNTLDKFNFYNLSRNSNIYNLEITNQIVAIGAWVLMPNHFHLLVTEVQPGGISKFMQKLTTAYSMYYNVKYEHTGGLFEGKFKSEHADNDRYLKYLFSYIHLNPIKLIQKDWKEKGIKDKKKALEYLTNYQHSSYLDYLRTDRSQKKIINLQSFPKYFPNSKAFNKEIFEWLSFKDPD